MRVLHVITGLAAGGAETQLRLLLRYSRHEADVAALYNAGVVADQLRSDGVLVTDLGMSSNRDVRAVARLVAIMRRGRYDVVHTHLYRACLYGRLAARLARVPRIVSTEHSLLDDQLEGRPATAGVKALYLAGERLGQTTIAVSEAVRANLLRWGIAGERIRTVPNGLDLAALAFDVGTRADVRRQLGIPQDAEVLGAVGRLHPGKRFDVLLEAVAPSLVRGRRLLLVGEGPERDRLEARAAELSIADRVHLVGERAVAPYLSAMDAFVSPSRYETFGLAVLEALANGLPVLYRRCPALDELGSPIAAASLLPEDDAALGSAVDAALGRAAPDRSCPAPLRRLAIASVASTIDEVYAERRGGVPLAPSVSAASGRAAGAPS
jgi:glycosyltransferase involved in cell wall biosynthesis